MINAMNMFNVQRMGQNPSMYDIGYKGGPGGGVAEAMRGTIATYRANLAAQQEQQNKLQQIRLTGQMDKPWLFDDTGAYRTPAAPDGSGLSTVPQIFTTNVPLKEGIEGTYSYSGRIDPRTGMPDYSTPVAVPGDLYTTAVKEQRAQRRLQAQKDQATAAQAQAKIQAQLDNLNRMFVSP